MATTLYINQNGLVTCAAHGGGYLQMRAKARPRARVIDTPLDNWERLTRAEVEEFNVDCETNRYDAHNKQECS